MHKVSDPMKLCFQQDRFNTWRLTSAQHVNSENPVPSLDTINDLKSKTATPS